MYLHLLPIANGNRQHYTPAGYLDYRKFMGKEKPNVNVRGWLL